MPVVLNLLANENLSAAVRDMARQRIRGPAAGVASTPTKWRLANQLAYPPVELRRFDDMDDSEFPFPRELAVL